MPCVQPVPTPLAQSSRVCQGWRVPGKWAVMLGHGAVGKAPVPRAEELACRRAGEVPIPQHRCLWLPVPQARSWVPPSALSLLGTGCAGATSSAEQPCHPGSIVSPSHGTPAASVPRKDYRGIEHGALAGLSPAQTKRAPHSPVTSGWTMHTSWGSGGDLLSWGAPSFSQATLGNLGDLLIILQDRGKG